MMYARRRREKHLVLRQRLKDEKLKKFNEMLANRRGQHALIRVDSLNSNTSSAGSEVRSPETVSFESVDGTSAIDNYSSPLRSMNNEDLAALPFCYLIQKKWLDG